MNTNPATETWKSVKNWLFFIGIMLVVIWLAHALAFFLHEYAHSFTAWLMGWKTNPLDLNYGHLNAGNLLDQYEIDENVDYDPIFAAGHGHQAGIIAAAGAAIGNGVITYGVSRLGYWWANRRGSSRWGLFFYWLGLASVGNFIDYVPARTFSPTGDMHTLIRGFECSPWWVIVVLGIPFFAGLLHFLLRWMPQAMQWLFPASPLRRIITIVVSALLLFGFYGSAGFGHGPAGDILSAISLYALVPLSILGEWWLSEKVYRIDWDTA